MSVQFGRWNFDGRPLASDYIDKVNATLALYGPDSDESYEEDGVKILYHAFHTTEESHREKQPDISASGNVITWDGRLDNRAELVNDLRDSVTSSSTDVAVVAAAYERWNANCFAKLIGDWAVSIWNPTQRLLILGKDPIGTHSLYYAFDNDNVTWSTILDPLVLFAGRTFALSEEYIAGWYSVSFPSVALTPYVGIHCVPPSSYVVLRPGKHAVIRYWDFDPGKTIRYHRDSEYEDHFRSVFAKAVQRKLRSDRPVLAELSGGMDSSSIVCMADTIIAQGAAETPRLDTISWYDDSYDHIEQDCNELHWITKVEDQRGRRGRHINLASLEHGGSPRSSALELEGDRFAGTPDSMIRLNELFQQYAAHMASKGLRVTLSGIGGDETTGGGVPTPIPELQNLLARARFVTLVRRLSAWGAKMRKSQFSLLWKAVRGFLPLRLQDLPGHKNQVDPWLNLEFVQRNYATLCAGPFRAKPFAALPSFQQNLATLNAVRSLLSNCPIYPEWLRDVRFPYLDRDFLEFMYAIPREQIVAVGKRRFLMRRALVGIVPSEVANRRRKAFVPQEPSRSRKWPSVAEMGNCLVGSSIGIIDPNRFFEILDKANRKEDVPVAGLKQTLTLEYWLRQLAICRVLRISMPKNERKCLCYSERLNAANEGEDLCPSTCAPTQSFQPERKPYCVNRGSTRVQLAENVLSLEKGGENHEIRNTKTDGIDACDQCHSGSSQESGNTN